MMSMRKLSKLLHKCQHCSKNLSALDSKLRKRLKQWIWRDNNYEVQTTSTFSLELETLCSPISDKFVMCGGRVNLELCRFHILQLLP